MDNKDWKYYRKLTKCGHEHESNLIYTPTVNPEETIMCMHYCIDTEYRSNTPATLTDELVEWFFEREAKFLTDLQYLKCTPEVYDIDYKNKKIFIEWNRETLSQVVNDPNRSIDVEIPNWKEQLINCANEFETSGYYKLALYPHCFFVKDGYIKTIDYYSVVPHNERYIERQIIEGVIGSEGAYRFNQSTTDGIIDFKKFFNITILQHLENYWPTNPFKEVYKKD